MLLHPGRGFGCALLLWMEKQPLLVLLRRLRLWRLRFRARFAWAAVAIGRAYCSMVVIVARPHVVLGVEFWRPGDLSWSSVRSALRQVRSSRSSSESFEVVHAVFLPPTAGRSLIGGTSMCSGPLLRVTALFSGLRSGDCGLPLLWMGHARI